MTHPLSIIVDGNNVCARNWFATRNADSCVELTERHLSAMQGELLPSRFVVCWDSRTSFRKELDATYKANREHDSAINLAIKSTVSMVQHAGWDTLEVPGFEADDLLATLSTLDLQAGFRCVLVTSDKDCWQLLRAGLVSQLTKWTGNRKEWEWMTAAALEEKHGATPAQWLEAKCLAGDDGDNVAGCERVGMPTAIKLVRSAGGAESAMHNVFSAGRALQPKLIAFRKRAALVRRLVTLRHDVPLPASWSTLYDSLAEAAT